MISHDHSFAHDEQAHHDHTHGHAHGHVHGPTSGRAFAISVTLNLGFVVIEAVAGIVGGSMALLADAGHNLSDVLALLMAWAASRLANRPPSAKYTYGLKSSSILAALANAALLWVALGAILIETVQRLAHPAPISGHLVMIVAGAGILVNGASAMLFAGGNQHDLNLRAAFQHMLADAAVSAGVVVAALLITLTGYNWIDPVTSLAILAIIGAGSWSLLRSSVKLGLLAVPDQIDETQVRGFLASQTGVTAVHDLHIWPMSTTETALTAHLVMPGGHPGDDFLHHLAERLEQGFAICHATIQIETEEGHDCALHPEEVV
ncbi:MAG: cation diffusion facilitator family transporter [Pseudomonadota bacterium]|nr:cation diffusion facilitator family transporter [Pseudomonadota bacterium]